MPEPLTPAQIEFLTQWLEDRQTRLLGIMGDMILDATDPLTDQIHALKAQVATLEEAVAVLDKAAVKVGARVALLADGGSYLCAQDGGPAHEGDPFELVARNTVGVWESFRVDRGQ